MKNLYKLCNVLNIGDPVSAPEKVAGGLLHKMWHVKTSHAEYAVKQLNSHIVTKSDGIKAIETSEHIARAFAQKGIAVAAALTFGNQSVIKVTDDYFIIYPWVDAKVLKPDEISIIHAQKMGAIIASLHQLNLQFNGVVNAQYELHPTDKFKNLIQAAVVAHFPYSLTLDHHIAQVLSWNQDFLDAIPVLGEKMIICHGDLDQKNVLWTQDQEAVIIDWESARLLNPMQEMLTAALDWSGVATGLVHQDIFTAFLKAYITAGSHITEKHLLPAFAGVQGNWLNWLYYNLERSLGKHGNHKDERTLGIKQAGLALNILITIDKNLKTWINTIHLL